MDFCVWLRTRFLAVFVGLWADGIWAVNRLARALPRLQIRSQWESWVHDDDTLSVMPIRMSVQGYYITVFDAIALAAGTGQTRLSSDARIAHAGRPQGVPTRFRQPYEVDPNSMQLSWVRSV